MTEPSTVPVPDRSIPALLPRDWPAVVQRLCDDLEASGEARRVALALVDSWVLAAADAAAPDPGGDLATP